MFWNKKTIEVVNKPVSEKKEVKNVDMGKLILITEKEIKELHTLTNRAKAIAPFIKNKQKSELLQITCDSIKTILKNVVARTENK